MGNTISHTHLLIMWMVEYTGVLINKCEIGVEGKTAHNRLKGKWTRIAG